MVPGEPPSGDGAVSPRAVDTALIAFLRKPGKPPLTSRLRREIGCTQAELNAAITRLRMKGKLHFTRLALSASMLDARAEDVSRAMEIDPVPAGDEGASVARAEAPATPAGAGAAGSDDPAAPHAAETRTPGQMLLQAIELYCAATGTAETLIGAVLFRHPGFVGLLRRRGTATAEKARAVERLFAAHPHGVPADLPSSEKAVPEAAPAAPAIAAPAETAPPGFEREWRDSGKFRMAVREQRAIAEKVEALRAEVVAEASAATSRKLAARRVTSVTPISLVETVQSLAAETPADLIVAVRRTHEALWRRCVTTGRAQGETPAAILYRALGAGLDALAAAQAGRTGHG